jgi:UDP-glucuronate 4-epimerase
LNYNKLKLLFKKNKFTYVLHLAAQAGVRYSFINPKKYIDTNINGFFNVINLSNEYKIKHFLYASSSSVYGLHKNKVSKEADDVNHPTSLYGATKRSNELIAHTYSHLHDLRTSGLRFFTVYGQYGRPDMSIFKFFKNNITNKKNFIFNYGNHQRSFTYIDDVVSAIYKIIVKKNKKSKKKLTKLYPDENLKNNFNIINVGNDQVVKLSDVIQKIENITKKKFKNLFLPLQKGDVIGSKASSKKLKNNFDFKFKTNISSGLKLFYKWFLNYKEFNINLKSK